MSGCANALRTTSNAADREGRAAGRRPDEERLAVEVRERPHGDDRPRELDAPPGTGVERRPARDAVPESTTRCPDVVPSAAPQPESASPKAPPEASDAPRNAHVAATIGPRWKAGGRRLMAQDLRSAG